MNISGKTGQLGIIGCPIEHTFSPKMHNFISEQLGNDYVYSAWRVEKEDLKQAIEGVRALGIAGINVTAPHKAQVIKYLDEISDQAKLLGSVNTIVNRSGKLYGYNTDAEGFCMAIKAEGIELKDKRLLVLGAGGVTRPTLMRIVREKPKSITILNRTEARAKMMADDIYMAMGYEIKTSVSQWDFDVVINTTSAGMAPNTNILPTDSIEGVDNLDFIDKNTAVVDMIYNPDQTRFLKEAKLRGAKTVNGLGMLIYQGIIAYELFTDTKLPDDMASRIRSEVFLR